MAVTNYQYGKLNPVIYFQNSAGEIWLPPSTEQALAIKDRMRARGFEYYEADSLDKIDKLQRQMTEWELKKRERELQAQELTVGQLVRAVRERLEQRAVSSSTTPYEREFIKLYLQQSYERRVKYREEYMHHQFYFEARESDSKYHFIDMVDAAVPDQKDTECMRCHKFRRIKGSNLCHRCAAEMGEEIQRQGGR